MKLKKVLIIMATMVVLVPMMQGVKSYAANTADSPYDYTLTTSNTSPAYTGFRAKEDASSIYIMPLAMTGSLSSVGVVVRGRRDDGTVVEGLTGSKHYYYTTTGVGYQVYNSVKEKELSYASVGFYSRSGSGSASGVWSPDCANANSYREMPYTR